MLVEESSINSLHFSAHSLLKWTDIVLELLKSIGKGIDRINDKLDFAVLFISTVVSQRSVLKKITYALKNV